MTEKNLRSLCAEWQKVLMLQDWRVKVNLARAHDLPDNAQGSANPLDQKKAAIIKVIDPIDHDPECMVPQDPEITLVHELLHLHFVPFQSHKKGAKKAAQEVVVDALSVALVALKRKEASNG